MITFRRAVLAAVIFASGAALAYAATTRGELSGDWFVYSGSLSERGAPTAKDSKVWMEITGPLALQMYNGLGKSAELKDSDVCGEGVYRERGEINCSLEPGEGARCWVNFDLRTGKVWGGTIC